ncbi:MAG: hypothetical protein IH820_12370, partial [Bacteroidetes bacterium]|nr:hypothetical protein [Bacteroidota bacterium]
MALRAILADRLPLALPHAQHVDEPRTDDETDDENNDGGRALLDTYKNEATAAGDLVLFRYFDFDVLPEMTYKYRVRLKIRNPLFGQPVEKLAQEARNSNKAEYRETPLSNETKPVTVSQDVDLFVNRVNDRRSLRVLNPTVTMLLYQWMSDLGTVVKGKVRDVQIGQTLAGEDPKTERLDPAKEILLFNAKSEFHTGSVVLDLRAGHRQLDDRHMTELFGDRPKLKRSLKNKLTSPDEVILLAVQVNPDGMELVSDWYMRETDPLRRSTRGVPVLYQKYAGHDNNRDFFMNNMPESKAVAQVVYNEWYPQIVYNQHQSSPGFARIVIPPYSDPVNPIIHPGVTTGLNEIGSAMGNRFALEKMPGAISDVGFSMWWNGGMRTVPYFHNMIGILTETAHATPSPRYFDPDSIPKMIAGRRGGGHPTNGTNIFYPYPWKGGESRFRDPVKYMLTGSMAVLRLAADLREHWLYGIYQMGRDAIDKGEAEAPYAYVIPPDQWNDGEEQSLVNVLRIGGVEVQRATEAFQAGDHDYPAGSYVIYAAQAFRPYLVDLLEKQDYPDRRSTPNGPPVPPYDLAGWTLPMQMGVQVDRVDTTFEAMTEPVTAPVAEEAGTVQGDGEYGYLFSHRPNASILAANRLLRDGEQVYWAGEAVEAQDQSFDAGTFVVSMAQPKRGVIRWLLGRTFYPDNTYTRDRDGNPIRPYDMSTDNIAEYMGVRVDPVDTAVEAALARVTEKIDPAGSIAKGQHGYVLDGRLNDSFKAVNLLWDGKVAVRRVDR